MATITSIGTALITTASGRGETSVVSTQGDKNDFVWTIEKSLDGTNWQAVKIDGDTTLTGSEDIEFVAASFAIYRVNVSSMGTATEIIVA